MELLHYSDKMMKKTIDLRIVQMSNDPITWWQANARNFYVFRQQTGHYKMTGSRHSIILICFWFLHGCNSGTIIPKHMNFATLSKLLYFFFFVFNN